MKVKIKGHAYQMDYVTTITNGRMHNPAHPGEILRDLYLSPLVVTIAEAAKALAVSRKHLSEFINGHVAIKPDMAARLAVALGTEPDIWINLQAQHDVWMVSQQPKPKVKALGAACGRKSPRRGEHAG